MGIYVDAVRSVACDDPKCLAAKGVACKATSAVVHPVRRKRAIDEGKWNPETALSEYDLTGEPLEAIRPRDRKR
jgi:hypothetical protein